MKRRKTQFNFTKILFAKKMQSQFWWVINVIQRNKEKCHINRLISSDNALENILKSQQKMGLMFKNCLVKPYHTNYLQIILDRPLEENHLSKWFSLTTFILINQKIVKNRIFIKKKKLKSNSKQMQLLLEVLIRTQLKK